MEKHSVESGNGTRDKARQELLALLEEMRQNVAASGVSDADLDQAIDDTIADVRANLP
jgi:hypothetical protein